MVIAMRKVATITTTNIATEILMIIVIVIKAIVVVIVIFTVIVVVVVVIETSTFELIFSLITIHRVYNLASYSMRRRVTF